MAEWQKVSTLDELEQFIQTVGSFHDGIIKEVHWVNGDNVDEDLAMQVDQLSSARVLVQRQFRNPSAVELYLERIWAFSLDTIECIFDSAGSTESVHFLAPPKDFLVLELEETKIVFERMQWRDASDGMGTETRFGNFNVPNW